MQTSASIHPPFHLLADSISANEPQTEPPTVPKSAELLVNTRHEYLGFGLHQSFCRVRVYVRGEHVICVISEQPDNPGTSVTNSIEQIASELLPDLVREPGRRDSITWVEHYSEEPESFDIVTFAVFVEANSRSQTVRDLAKLGSALAKADREKLGSFRNPNWRRIERSDLESLIGMAWEE